MLTLKTPEGYDPLRAPVVSAAAAQLDTLLASLRRRMKEASVAQLEWQLRPGVNTVGMLLAHLAVSEAYWVAMFSPGVGDADAERARLSLKEKVAIVLELQRIYLPFLERRRPLKPWERPWDVEP